jgi:hypothetical protein
MLQDPTGASELLSDTDYQVYIDLEDNVYRAAAGCARAIAAQLASKIDVKAGPVSVKDSQKYEHYISLAKGFEQRAREGGGGATGSGVGGATLTGISLEEIELQQQDSDRYPGVFYRGFDENPPGDTYESTEE